MNLINVIKEKRPELSESSIKTYDSILRNLYIKIFKSDKFDINKFNDTDIILKYLADIPANKRKTILSALFVISGKPEYKEQMLTDIGKYNDEQDTQIKNEKQTASWVDTSDIKVIAALHEAMAKTILKRGVKDVDDLQTIQNYIILCLLSGLIIPPRRLKDYTEFKINNITYNDNFLQGNKFIFNNYKTAKHYGQQVVDVPPKLLKIIKSWIKINPTDYLLFDNKLNKLSNVTLNQRLNKIFNNKVSVNQLRHTYLSDKYQDTIKTHDNLKNDFSKMGSSILQEKVYIKHH